MSSPRPTPLATPWGTLGDLATASFVLAALTGAVLAIPYDPANAYGSIATLLLANAPGSFFRNLHYWSAQFCLVLSVLHLADHLWLSTEGRVRRGAWLRLTLSLPILVYLMLSGFLLRGDLEGQQALRIVSQILGQVPVLGAPLVTLLFGRGGRLDVVYVQHAATATILVWLFIQEHTRRLWPRPAAFLAAGLAATLLSLGFSPGLHDGLDPIVKGPWYFLGLQEILHWTRWPVLVPFTIVLLVAILYAIPRLKSPWARRAKWTLLGLGLVYGGLCGVGGVLRGESWSWGPAWPRGGGNLQVGWVFARTPAAPVPLPLVQGHPEGCLVCHVGMTGLGNAHRPEAVGCASCHGGNPLTLQKSRAHAGMIRIPGNLADAARSCGTSACHAEIIPRVDRSVMTTMAGVVAVDRHAFGEAPAPGGGIPKVAALGHSPADTHLRQLCAGCHLGTPKEHLGTDTGDTPGGGCLACHLVYSPAAQKALATDQRQRSTGRAEAPKVHPALSLDLDDGKCFFCHSRSGRISLAYEGWMELQDPPDSLRGTADQISGRYRTLADDRVLERITPDIHQEKGMACVDCHTATEVMGDGTTHAFKREQVRLACQDCHSRPGQPLPSLPLKALDPESRRLLVLRAWPGGTPQRFIRTERGEALVNGTFDETSGRPMLIRKKTGQRLPLLSQISDCSAPAHARLACGACHTAWTPSCASCHTSFDRTAESYDWIARKDVAGAWVETSQAFEARPPTLGIQAGEPGGQSTVQTFAPGMVMTLDRPGVPTTFQRRYARSEPHTTTRRSRPCASCHNDSQALGYGRGQLRFAATGRDGRWTFIPALPPGPDGLPADAWIPFLGTRTEPVSTRLDVRPFSVDEQRRILTVGACLTCHDGASHVMRNSLHDFKGLLARRSPRCRLPVW